MKTLSLVVSSVILLCACGDRVQGLDAEYSALDDIIARLDALVAEEVAR